MSFLGAIGRTIGGAVKGFVTGGPIGAVTGAVRGAVSRPASPGVPPSSSGGSVFTPTIFSPPPVLGGGTPGFNPGLMPFVGPDVPKSTPGAVPQIGFRGALERFLPFGQSGYQGAPPGYHVNKAYLTYLRGQQMGKTLVDPTKAARVTNAIVRNRKMNPLNPRALRRANARQVAAVRLMRRTLRGTGYQISRHSFGRKKGRK